MPLDGDCQERWRPSKGAIVYSRDQGPYAQPRPKTAVDVYDSPAARPLKLNPQYTQLRRSAQPPSGQLA